MKQRGPDAEVVFELLSTASGGRQTSVSTGYHPAYEVRPDYWTSARHRFIDSELVQPGDTVRAEVCFLTPEAYPHALTVGQRVTIAEGRHVVGYATITRILNRMLAAEEYPSRDG